MRELFHGLDTAGEAEAVKGKARKQSNIWVSGLP